jgi:Fe(3+) dicitrate transport protein
MIPRILLTLLLLSLRCTTMFAQQGVLYGRVTTLEGKAIAKAEVGIQNTSTHAYTDSKGHYRLENLKLGKYMLMFFAEGMQTVLREIEITGQPLQLNIQMEPLQMEMEQVTIRSKKDNSFGITRLRSVEGTAIYEAKKTEVIVMEDITANVAANNSRQIFSKVAGLNIWESDAAGIQLGIGGRGLNPNRTSEFNVRQNGYDITADALGYPEAYYTPPAEALEKIEIVRGAASLQYGTQFGGVVNFVFKKGTENKPLEVVSRQTIGSWGFFNSFNSVGGSKGRFRYYTFYQRKQGKGWRPNSDFQLDMAYSSVTYQANDKLSLTGEYTFMNYLAQQAGGLTDRHFEQDPRQSIRNRNWFAVNWNLPAFIVDYRFNERTKLNSRSFGLVSSRDALGFLGLISRADHMQERDLIADNFLNFGNETRLIHRYNLFNQQSTVLVGSRYFQGNTRKRQGFSTSGNGPDFFYLHPDSLEGSDYRFPNKNFSLFAENIFNLSPRFSITPGIRFEHIQTFSNGYYTTEARDLAGNLLMKQTIRDKTSRKRSFVLLGLGTSYKLTENNELYANISQNYRAINFNDLRIVNPNLKVNPDISDETGYNADMGMRGNISNTINYDISLFYLRYNNRIGSVMRLDSILYNVYRYRTNISDSRNIGIEAFAEVDVLKLLTNKERESSLSVFTNFSYIDARYIGSEEAAVRRKKVEQVPPVILKTGLSYKRDSFKATWQYAYTGEQFTDATNARFDANAVVGIIPAYQVMDLSLSYAYKIFTLSGSINNLTDNQYFTRRADGYPGPGIIPANGRSFFLTLELKL